MKRVLFAASAAFALSCSFATAQTSAPSTTAPAATNAPAAATPAAKPAAATPPAAPVKLVAGAPANKPECLKMLRSFAEHVDEGKASPEAVEKAKPMGRAMTTYCNTGKYNEAFALHKQIGETLGKK
jgi:hypothetical protein